MSAQPLRVCVLGASGGIGAALVTQLAARPETTVYAGARKAIPATAHNVIPFAFDLTDEASIVAAAATIADPLDLVIVATGILQSDAGHPPEKSWRSIDAEIMTKLLEINVVGPALIAKHLLPLLARDRRSVFAALSARVGSIGDNRLGGWHSYRASKAALNMLIRNFAIEVARTHPQAIAVALHPGTVDTPLSKPFQGNVVAGKLFTPEESAAHLLGVIAGLTHEDSGAFLGWDGTRIAF